MAASGWYADPTQRHEYRYHDGVVWTEHVADRGQVTSDPLTPPGRPPSSGSLAPQASRAGSSAQDSFKKLAQWADRRMQDGAAWVAQRGGSEGASGAPVLDVEPSASILGQWSGLAGAVQNYAVATSGIAGGAEMLGVLRAVAGSEDAQSRLLRSIDVKVDALVKGPYNTGRTYLREAQRLGADDPAGALAGERR